MLGRKNEALPTGQRKNLWTIALRAVLTFQVKPHDEHKKKLNWILYI